MKTNYIINKMGHYFKTECKIDIDKLDNCQLFNSLNDLYKTVCEQNDLCFDEVDCNEIYINPFYVEHDPRGIQVAQIDPSFIELYISQWEL